MRHENDHLAADRLQWVGLWASELTAYVHTTLHGGRALISPLTLHDTYLRDGRGVDLASGRIPCFRSRNTMRRRQANLTFHIFRALLRSKPPITTLLSTRAPHSARTERVLICTYLPGTYAPETSQPAGAVEVSPNVCHPPRTLSLAMPWIRKPRPFIRSYAALSHLHAFTIHSPFTAERSCSTCSSLGARLR